MMLSRIIIATCVTVGMPLALVDGANSDEFIYSGKWGSWKDWKITDEPDYYGCGAQVRIEGKQGRGDDTAANGLKIKFCDRDKWNLQSSETIYKGIWGDWGAWKMCHQGYFIHGAQVRFEKSQGRGDDTALNGLKVLCVNPKSGASDWMTVENGFWGSWREAVEAKDGHFLKGARVRFEDSQKGGDDTAWNGLEMRFKEMGSDPWCVREESDCFEIHSGTGCDDDRCEELVCNKDSFCCDNSYDKYCRQHAKDLCNVCDRRMLRA